MGCTVLVPDRPEHRRRPATDSNFTTATARHRRTPVPGWVTASRRCGRAARTCGSWPFGSDSARLLRMKDSPAPQHGSHIRMSELVGWPMGSPSQHARNNGMQRVTYTILTDCRIFRLRQCLGCFCNRPGLIILAANCGGLDRVDSLAGASGLFGYLRHSRRRRKKANVVQILSLCSTDLGPEKRFLIDVAYLV